MRIYSVFGLRLGTELELPDAQIADTAQYDCLLEQRREPPPDARQVALGEDAVIPGVIVRSYETPGGFRLAYDDTGTFDVGADGARIVWWSDGREPDDAVQIDILGRVLAFALHARDVFTLHSSAVRIGTQGVAFLAPKGVGKSTIAAALAAQGAELVTDDTLAVAATRTPIMHGGIRTIRLRADSAARMHLTASSPASAGKRIYHPSSVPTPPPSATPLRAAYCLSPAREDEASPVTRQRLSPLDSALSYVCYRKLGPLLGGAAAARSFHLATALAMAVPVYTLSVARRLDRLEQVAQMLLEWHADKVEDAETNADAHAAQG